MKSPREIASSLGWNYAGRIADAGGTYVVGILVAHALSIREYGLYALVVSGMQMVIAFSSMGAEVALNRFIPGLLAEKSSPAIRFLVRNLALARVVLAVVAAAGVSFLLNAAAKFGSPTSTLVAFAVFSILRSVIPLLGISMVAQLQTRIPSSITIATRIADIVVVGILAALGATFDMFIIALTCTSVLQTVALLVFLRPSLAGPIQHVALRPILAFGGIFWINVLVDFILGRYGDVVLLGLLGPDKDQIGLYEAGAGLVQAAGLLLTTGMGGVNLALFSELARQEGNNNDRMRRFYHALVRITSALTLPLMVFLIVDAGSVLKVLYTDRFVGAWFVVRAFAGVRIVARLFGGGENTEALLAQGKVGLVSSVGVIAALLNLVGDILLIPTIGAAGAVLATSVAYLAVTCSTFYFVRKNLGVQLQPEPYLRLLGGGVIGGAILSLLPDAGDFLMLGIHVIVFSGVTIGTWALLKPLKEFDVETAAEVHPRLGSALRAFARSERP